MPNSIIYCEAKTVFVYHRPGINHSTKIIIWIAIASLHGVFVFRFIATAGPIYNIIFLIYSKTIKPLSGIVCWVSKHAKTCKVGTIQSDSPSMLAPFFFNNMIINRFLKNVKYLKAIFLKFLRFYLCTTFFTFLHRVSKLRYKLLWFKLKTSVPHPL